MAFNSLPKDKVLELSKVKSICRGQYLCDSKVEICFVKSRKLCGKRRKCWLPAFSSFPTIFQKASELCSRVNAVFVCYIAKPVHLSMLSWISINEYSAQYSSQATGSFPTIVETMDIGERGINLVINPLKEYWPSLGIKPATSCSQVLCATD